METPTTKSCEQDEEIVPADGPDDLPIESPDLSGPGNSIGKPNTDHNLVGKGRCAANDGDHSPESDEPWPRNHPPGNVESHTSGTAPSRNHLQHVVILTGKQYDGSGYIPHHPSVKIENPTHTELPVERKSGDNALSATMNEGGIPRPEDNQTIEIRL